MIEQKDYIIVQIEQIGRLLATLFKQLNDRKMLQARETAEKCFSVLNLDRDKIRTGDPEQIADAIPDPRLLAQLADVLSIYAKLAPEESVLRLHRAAVARLEKENILVIES